ncbi:polysaccharide biosynthesis tyrosine autokinase [Brachybacterium paraconglomeratum]|uniref:polysaccharide biosynthesis tyrosine autokinase n=1 Tax=Brachybacterium paraconglomeratum TaxID=173362 RepID=UPI003FD3F871
MEKQGMTVQTLLSAVRKFWWLVAVLGLVGGVASFAYSSAQTPLYRSTASLHFALEQGASAVDLNQGSAYTQSQMLSYAQLVTGSRVLGPVIDELGLDTTPRELARSIEVTIPQDTVTMKVTVTTTGPESSAELASSISEHLMDEVQTIAPKTPDGGSTITVVVYDDAVPPTVQSSPNKAKDALIGAAAGGAIGIAAALLITVLDTRMRTEEELASATGLPVLGVIGRSPLLARRSIAMLQQRLSRTTEEFLRIRGALTYANVVSEVKVLLVTACRPGEGKSTISVNLAMSLAGENDSVLLIDADLRRPRAHEYAGLDGAVGLTNVLAGEVDLKVATYRFPDTELDLLPAGAIPPNPAELLTSDAMRQLIAEMSARYRYVIIDTPPVLSVADATLMSPLADGVVIAIDARRTRRSSVAQTTKILEGSGARILGTVLNRVRPPRRRESYYSDVTD